MQPLEPWPSLRCRDGQGSAYVVPGCGADVESGWRRGGDHRAMGIDRDAFPIHIWLSTNPSAWIAAGLATPMDREQRVPVGVREGSPPQSSKRPTIVGENLLSGLGGIIVEAFVDALVHGAFRSNQGDESRARRRRQQGYRLRAYSRRLAERPALINRSDEPGKN